MWSVMNSYVDSLDHAYDQYTAKEPNLDQAKMERPLVYPYKTDSYYKRYMDLLNNTPYKYPASGTPRERHGRSGGNWRHIKEVLCNGGNRVVFVDGLVSQYDNGTVPLSAPGNRVAAINPQPVIDREDIVGFQDTFRQSQQCKQPIWHGSSVVHLPDIRTARDPQASPSKYKGFYTVRQ